MGITSRKKIKRNIKELKDNINSWNKKLEDTVTDTTSHRQQSNTLAGTAS